MILQTHMPYDPADRPRLPGIRPLEPAEWLLVDDAFAAQMAERERLITTGREAVIAECPGARPAILEALEVILERLPEGYAREGDDVVRPDGATAQIDRTDPLATLGHLVQDDICIMQRPDGGDEHVLTAAVLCFPARWRLAEKIGRPLIAIHEPVPEYDSDLAPRVQRLFDGVRVGRPLWRVNELWTDNPTLFQPEPPANRPKWRGAESRYLRSERQCLVRLPETGAVVFSIHTYMVAAENMPSRRPADAPAE
ncbi:heme-dependent oxidative N-demethylase family protein [Roseivivax marinus]|uniref:heme-dependent oxidative N-demethylase family protein n=1 Tax=Roseivivax marinus TaxID=1379903 RepID=UPI00273F43FE|nr:DUF3445 domain-containing protein [Roseivivax marinus]